eukprot:6296964-Lingulodinium_polyedra.AAC.1
MPHCWHGRPPTATSSVGWATAGCSSRRPRRHRWRLLRGQKERPAPPHLRHPARQPGLCGPALDEASQWRG